jgi:dihydrodipicolinate synthase/N-acetylneuraminate lyase
MISARDLRGVVPPLLTPIQSDETVDESALRRLAAYLLDGGCHAFFVQGSSGEFPTLPAGQRCLAMRAVVDTTQGRVPVLAGIAAASYAEAVGNAEMAVACGAHACVATTPYYFTYSQGELIDYFTRLADEIDLPLIVYNIPQRTGNPLRPETILTLSEHPNIIAMKDTSENFMMMTRLIAALRGRDDFALFSGTETLMAPAVLAGAAGGVLGIGNLAPHFCVRLYEAAAAGDLARTRELQDQMENLFRAFFTYSYGEPSIGAVLGGLKLAVSLLGLGDERLCFPGHRPGEVETMQKLVDGWIERGIITPPA